MPDVLLELFSEEIPARFQVDAENLLRDLLDRMLAEEGLEYQTLAVASTPRRLTAMIHGLPSQGQDQRIEKRGPRVESPDTIVQKFAASMHQDPSQLVQEGGYWFARAQITGRPTESILSATFPLLIRQFSWPKSMVWASRSFSWVRPLRSILAFLDQTPLSFDVEDLHAGNVTWGHRSFGTHPLTVQSIDHYQKVLADHGVVLTREARALKIKEQIQTLCAQHNLTWLEETSLFEEVVGLVENPVVLLGQIPPPFMDLPPQLLTTVMSHHQRYFATQHHGVLAPYFLCVANTAGSDQGTLMMQGYERVLKARLADARFFYDQDLQKSLSDHAVSLQKLLFTKDLGTMADKAQRIGSLARNLAPAWSLDPDDGLILQTASLLKADLGTAIVTEFPELQGDIGAHYGERSGLPAQACTAIQEHHRVYGEEMSISPLGALMGIADRLDTLVGFCGMGQMPTGSKDPFGLRRATLGVVRMAWIHPSCVWSLEKAIIHAYQSYADAGITLKISCAQVQETLSSFFKDRIRVLLKKYDHDVVSALLDAPHPCPLVQIPAWVEALQHFISTPAGSLFISAYRRVNHLLKREEAQEGALFQKTPDVGLMDNIELQLYQMCQHGEASTTSSSTPQALFLFWGMLGQVIHTFVETHRVNDPRPEHRLNRLYLLNMVRRLVSQHIAYDKLEKRETAP